MVEFDLNVEVIEAEADLSFQNKLQEEFIDRFRRILNSDVYMPGSCRRLAERCEALLGHLKLNTIHLPVVHGLEEDFAPVFGICSQIAVFLEKVLDMSWANRRVLYKDELSQKAQQYAHRVDDVSCQVMIKLKLRASSPHVGGGGTFTYDNGRRNGSMDSTDSAASGSEYGATRTLAIDAVHALTNTKVLKGAGSIIFLMAFLIGVVWTILT